MKVTQEQLNAPLFSITGESFDFKKDVPLTMRHVFIETILFKDEGRSGQERLNGVKVAEKINTQMGELDLEEAEVKLIEDRMDKSPILTNNDYLYTLVQRFFHPPAAPALLEEDDILDEFEDAPEG